MMNTMTKSCRKIKHLFFPWYPNCFHENQVQGRRSSGIKAGLAGCCDLLVVMYCKRFVINQGVEYLELLYIKLLTKVPKSFVVFHFFWGGSTLMA